MKILKISFLSLIAGLVATGANAFEYEYGNAIFKLNGHGTIGVIEPDFKDPVFIGDWRVRGQATYALSDGNSVGLVYALDELATYQDKYSRDAFAFFESANLGRLEIGLTDSIATKLGVGLPDVGGLRLNDNSLLYKKVWPDGAVISNTTTTSGRYAPRINLVTVPTRSWQFGVSASGLTSDYKYAADVGAKYRDSDGKTKTAVSIGASFIDAPDGLHTDVFAPAVIADWRAQFSAGLNLQYNSWIWGMSGRVIYDQNAISPASDGMIVGTGVSYDFLEFNLSASYIFSDTGIWDDDVPDFSAHTGILSFRYKYSENIDGWISTGVSTQTPFLSAGIRAKF